jgi:hypothetical protein
MNVATEDGVMNAATQLARSQEIAGNIAHVFEKRAQNALEQYGKRLRAAVDGDASSDRSVTPFAAQLNPWSAWHYTVDVAQRSLLFWDTMCERGTQYVERTAQELKPALHFDYDVVLDGRHFARPVNYALI